MIVFLFAFRNANQKLFYYWIDWDLKT